MGNSRTSAVSGFFYIFLAFPLVLVGGLVLLLVLPVWVALLLPSLVVPTSISITRRGLRHLRTYGEADLRLDARPLVLFLREFGQEGEIVEEVSSSGRKSFEQMIVGVFWHLGPVVTISRPDERLPQIGALRLYAEDNVWQQKVSELLERSCMVIIQANGRYKSMGLIWEISRAFVQKPFKPILLAFAFGYGGIYSERERYLNFKESFEQTTGLGLPPETSQYIYFENRTTPRALQKPEMALAIVDQEADRRFVRWQRHRGWVILALIFLVAPFCLFLLVVLAASLDSVFPGSASKLGAGIGIYAIWSFILFARTRG